MKHLFPLIIADQPVQICFRFPDLFLIILQLLCCDFGIVILALKVSLRTRRLSLRKSLRVLKFCLSQLMSHLTLMLRPYSCCNRREERMCWMQP